MPGSRLTSALRLLVIPAIVGITVFAAWKLGYFELDRRQALLDTVQRLRQLPHIEIAFVLGFALAVALCLPANIATMLAGAVFGWRVGSVVSLAGGLLGTAAAYWLARTVAQKPVKRLFGTHRLLTQLKEHDTILRLFQLRVVPVAPFAVLSYVAGIARVSLKRLLIATAIGGLAGSVAYAFAGQALLEGIVTESAASKRALILAGSVTLGMLLLSFVVGFFRRERD